MEIAGISVVSEDYNQGQAKFSIANPFEEGKTLAIIKDSDDPDGTGELSYSWQTSSDNTNWNEISW